MMPFFFLIQIVHLWENSELPKNAKQTEFLNLSFKLKSNIEHLGQILYFMQEYFLSDKAIV